MKKFIKIMLVGTLAMALSSCGGDKEPASTEDTAVVDTQEENTEENAEESTEENAEENTDSSDAFADGFYFAESADFDDSGYKTTASVMVMDGKITEVTIDAYKEDGTTKREAVESGEYDMSVAGAEKSWTEQADLFGEYIVSSQETSVDVNDEGKTDAVSGVTIAVSGYMDLVNEALTTDPVEILRDEEVTEAPALNPGTYTVEADDFDSSTGFKDKVELVVDDNGAIAKVTIDAYKEDGTTKREAVESGEYDMSVAGAEKTWTEQADLFAEYVVENQTNSVPMDGEGKTDAVSGVTISVKGYVRLLDDALTLAE